MQWSSRIKKAEQKTLGMRMVVIRSRPNSTRWMYDDQYLTGPGHFLYHMALSTNVALIITDGAMPF